MVTPMIEANVIEVTSRGWWLTQSDIRRLRRLLRRT